MSVCMVVGPYCSLTCPNDVLYTDPQSLCLSVCLSVCMVVGPYCCLACPNDVLYTDPQSLCLSVWWWAPTAA